MKKKVEGSDTGSVETDGLKEKRQGTEKGKGKSKPLEGGIPNVEIRDAKPYPNKHKVVKDEYHGIDVTVEADDRAIKEYEKG